MLTTPRGSDVTSAIICETRLATSAVCPGILTATVFPADRKTVGHLAEDSVPQAAVPGPGRGLERAAGGRDGRAGLGFTAVGPPAQYHSGSGIDRFRDGAGPNPLTVDPVLGDLTHARAPSALREQRSLDDSSSTPWRLEPSSESC